MTDLGIEAGSAAGGTAATVRAIGERALIARIVARLARPSWAVVGPGDDAAVIEPRRGALDVLTTDAFVEDVHFDRRFCPPDAIGHKALAVNLSDLAAMGAAPRAALLSLILPDDLPVADIDRLLDGMLALAGRHRVAIVGGNISRTAGGAGGPGPGRGPLVVDITALGTVGRRQFLTRGGARPGDDVYVTGSIGGGAVGLRALQADAATRGIGDARDATRWAACEARYLRPEPRTRVGMLLGRGRAATACMDLSDGLADAVRQVAAASNVGLAIDGESIPIEDAARDWYRERGDEAALAAIAGGDDYELLFTARPAHRGRLRAVRSQAGDLPITKIGVVTKDARVVLRTADGDRDLPEGFEHFR